MSYQLLKGKLEGGNGRNLAVPTDLMLNYTTVCFKVSMSLALYLCRSLGLIEANHAVDVWWSSLKGCDHCAGIVAGASLRWKGVSFTGNVRVS